MVTWELGIDGCQAHDLFSEHKIGGRETRKRRECKKKPLQITNYNFFSCSTHVFLITFENCNCFSFALISGRGARWRFLGNGNRNKKKQQTNTQTNKTPLHVKCNKYSWCTMICLLWFGIVVVVLHFRHQPPRHNRADKHTPRKRINRECETRRSFFKLKLQGGYTIATRTPTIRRRCV